MPRRQIRIILWAICLTLWAVASPGAEEYEMIRIPAGTFTMGSPEDEPLSREDEQLHEVTLTRDFYIGRYEVTQVFYERVMGNNPSYNNVCPACPVESLTWFQALEFCNTLSRREGLRPVYTIRASGATQNLDADGYRLPLEAEWEYAARAGGRTIFPNGNCLSTSEANFNGYLPQPGCEMGMNRAETIPVGQFAPNGWGLFDMTGNINEFCWDWYADYTAEPQVDPQGGPPASYRVFRGGAFNNFAARSHCASRQKLGPDDALDMVGIRLVRTVGQKGGER